MQSTRPVCAERTQVLDTLLTESAFNTHVRGDCMTPLIQDQSKVTVEPGSKLKCGDVMVWRDNSERMVCHRFLGRFPGRRGTGAVSWADSVSRPDGLVAMSRVLGRVSKVDGVPLNISLLSRARARLRYLRYAWIRVTRLISS